MYSCYIQSFEILASFCSWSDLIESSRRYVFAWRGSIGVRSHAHFSRQTSVACQPIGASHFHTPVEIIKYVYGILTISHAHVWYRKSLCKIICPDPGSRQKKIKEREKERERKKGNEENSEVWVIKLKVITEEVFIHPHLEQKHPVVEFLHTFSLQNICWNICVLCKISVKACYITRAWVLRAYNQIILKQMGAKSCREFSAYICRNVPRHY